jgi:hypothetical protein
MDVRRMNLDVDWTVEGRGSSRLPKPLALSLPTNRGLAATRLGHHAVILAIGQCLLASGASLLGALLPLLIAVVLPGPPGSRRLSRSARWASSESDSRPRLPAAGWCAGAHVTLRSER